MEEVSLLWRGRLDAPLGATGLAALLEERLGRAPLHLPGGPQPIRSLAWCTGAAQGEVRLSTGIEYTTGTYGNTEDIEDLYVPVTLSMTSGRIGASVTVPYISVTGT